MKLFFASDIRPSLLLSAIFLHLPGLHVHQRTLTRKTTHGAVRCLALHCVAAPDPV